MRSVVFALVIVGLAAAPGCMASFSERPPLPEYPGPGAPVDVHLQAFGKSFLYVGGMHGDEFMEAPLGGSLAGSASRAILDSGWIRAVGKPEYDTLLTVQVADYQGPGPGLLQLATAFLIPGVMDRRIDVRVELARAGQVARSCTQSTVVRTWYQTFLIFVYPFRSPTWNCMKSTEALALRCLADVLEQDRSPGGAI